MPIWRRLFWQVIRRAASRADCTAGNKSPTRMPMIAITTNSSTRVKPPESAERLRGGKRGTVDNEFMQRGPEVGRRGNDRSRRKIRPTRADLEGWQALVATATNLQPIPCSARGRSIHKPRRQSPRQRSTTANGQRTANTNRHNRLVRSGDRPKARSEPRDPWTSQRPILCLHHRDNRRPRSIPSKSFGPRREKNALPRDGAKPATANYPPDGRRERFERSRLARRVGQEFAVKRVGRPPSERRGVTSSQPNL